MAVWDASLPQYVDASGYTEKEPTGKIETQMDTGRPVMRSLYTAVATECSFTLTMTNEQVTTFKYFYRTTCANGTLPFTWIHPRTYDSATMRFLGEYPSIVYKAYNTYAVSFTVEIAP